ncbi:hypothetical protein MsedC_0857 [Metallosphaera sedula]|uniref:Uncharacterized protein n=1 Tax=Metallosphaera sedula TaxID=43687 RepID=A0A0K1SH60_9CREN|nr:hypothetical protein MsedA_0857 [Metallosphaera sedula]AKV76163.1 hypothetical protein MsedB_0858 [Metallosphaera sedula]AKV78414.1 hypothetical protein MsedC_0857 [Metallosphaera sedula]AKV80659.1 hypothetical protein MsedD_0858 [Metallosphaera sedula]AKV82903.1 hypothetical protein MsedE_0858 [Metallosphaera sedula]
MKKAENHNSRLPLLAFHGKWKSIPESLCFAVLKTCSILFLIPKVTCSWSTPAMDRKFYAERPSCMYSALRTSPLTLTSTCLTLFTNTIASRPNLASVTMETG